MARRAGRDRQPRDLQHRPASPGRDRAAARLSGAGGGRPLHPPPRSVLWRSMTVGGRHTLDDVRHWAAMAARAADAKKADDIVILSVGEVLSITDAFVIASAGNPRLVRTIVEEVEKQVKEGGGPSP